MKDKITLIFFFGLGFIAGVVLATNGGKNITVNYTHPVLEEKSKVQVLHRDEKDAALVEETIK